MGGVNRGLKKNLEAAIGFEPMNRGFANRCLRPLDYAAWLGASAPFGRFGFSASRNFLASALASLVRPGGEGEIRTLARGFPLLQD